MGAASAWFLVRNHFKRVGRELSFRAEDSGAQPVPHHSYEWGMGHAELFGVPGPGDDFVGFCGLLGEQLEVSGRGFSREGLEALDDTIEEIGAEGNDADGCEPIKAGERVVQRGRGVVGFGRGRNRPGLNWRPHFCA